MSYFSLEEFIIEDMQSVPKKILDKIQKYHITPMEVVRENLGMPIYPSQKSCYRSRVWELNRGRSGYSLHTFRGLGACDWTCKNFKKNGAELLRLIVEHTNYTRITIYAGFIHCDYKQTFSRKRQIFTSTSDSRWTLR